MSTPAVDHHHSLPRGPEASRPGLLPRLGAEAFGTLFIVVAGLGVPLFTIPDSSPLPAALAAGLAVTAAMLAFARVSGGHFNPAITLGHLLAGRIRAGAAAAYAGAQLVGGLAGALALFGILRTLPGIADSRTAFDTVAAGFGEHSIIQAPLAAVLLLEMLGAAIIVAVFLGTSGKAPAFGIGNAVDGGRESSADGGRYAAAVAVGLSFAVLLQLGQSVGNLPFNPARAVSSAVFSSGWAAGQLWAFLAAPLVGAAIAGLVFRSFGAAADTQRPATKAVSGGQGADGTPPAAAAVASADGPAHRRTDRAQDGTSEAQDFFEGTRG
ncbi:aquaporin [Pseudarthrobacter sp. L1SW]|uniref:aquaporin n=1 Tax=Pseudarthrobacter sp. L1SW TaxID=2851598 RepID=UPI001E341A0B|nr:aquaporin [Pseudarthrobacter sp. L1SW]UEL27259.1 aquaporin [Pseudarthrobacter sp. L1SW]